LNKNLAVFTALVLGVAALAHAQGQMPTKVAIINVQNAILSTKEGQKAANDIQTTLLAPKKADLDRKQADVAALQDQLRKGSATMSQDAKEKLQRDIDAKSKNLTRDTEDASAELDAAQGKVMQDLGNKMLVVIEKYATQNGIALVIDVSNPQTPVLWAASAIDITNDIVKLYDQAYPVAAAAPAAPASKQSTAAPPAKPAAPPAAPPAQTTAPPPTSTKKK
jgi:outer membrane protein